MVNVPRLGVVNGGNCEETPREEAPREDFSPSGVDVVARFTRESAWNVLIYSAMKTRPPAVQDFVASVRRKINPKALLSAEDIVAIGRELFLCEADIRDTLQRIAERAHSESERVISG